MKNFLVELLYRFQMFMRGRYGMDTLSHFASVCALVCLLVSSFFGLWLFYYIALALIFISYYRCFSKNLDRRGRELCTYLKYKNKVVSFVKRHKKMFSERKAYRFFKCKNCGAYSRVSRGKGKVKITCGICKNTMIKKT